MMTQETALRPLADCYGIAADYIDAFGKPQKTLESAQEKILAALGVALTGDGVAAFQQKAWEQCLPLVWVARGEELAQRPLPLRLPTQQGQQAVTWTLTTESGEVQTGHCALEVLTLNAEATVGGVAYQERLLPLPTPLPEGYHQLRLTGATWEAVTRVIVTPSRCYLPPALQSGRTWGPAVQLYALRSRRNWGCGDFTDLTRLVDWCRDSQAGVVGLNPLHGLFPENPMACSPYSPSSRMLLNIFYLDVEAIPEFQACEAAQRLAQEQRETLTALQNADMVDYPAMATAKKAVLEVLYRTFRETHLTPGTERGQAFRRFQEEGGETLQRFTLFEALQEHFQRQNRDVWGWPLWPEAYRTPESDAVQAFAQTHAERVEFYQYLQWQAHLQLQAIQARCREFDLPVGLYMDLAVGVNPGGAETWAAQDLYALSINVGCPPDLLNMKGQNWGLPPMRPDRLQALGYEPFIQTLRFNMQYAGALRIDHFMALMRLFWIPAGAASAAEGAYVAYPFEDLLGVLALESHRNQCLVVGEDLGTVPPVARERMQAWGVLSYKVFFFEKQEDGAFIPPEDYPEEALVTFSTHDLPTLRGFLQGRDIEVRTALDLFPSEETRQQQLLDRDEERRQLMAALLAQGLLSESAEALPRILTPELRQGIYGYLARTRSKLAMFQLEDVLDQLDQVNLPGTVDEHPNWRRKLSLPLEDLAEHPALRSLCEMFRSQRPR